MKYFKFHYLDSCKIEQVMMVLVIFTISLKLQSDEIYFYTNVLAVNGYM